MKQLLMTITDFITYFKEYISTHPHAVIAIDGRCASGKTTLSSKLQELFSIDVIHMDDFFLPLPLRTEKRLAECGGNVHYERFAEEVMLGIQSKQPFSYRQFSCKQMDYVNMIEVSNNHPILIEGAYSLRQEFQPLYDLKVFMDIDANIQKERLIQRNGIDGYTAFEERWIPKEEAYLSTFSIQEQCTIIL